MKKNFKYKYFFGTVDFVVLLFSFFISIYVLRSDPSIPFFEFFKEIPEIIFYLILSSVITLFVFQYNGLYRLNIILDRTRHFINLLKAIYYSTLQIIFFIFLIDLKLLLNSKLLLVFFFVVSFGIFFIIRLEFLRFIFLKLNRSTFKRDVIIVGNGKSGKLLAAKLIYESLIGLNILGFVDDQNNKGDIIIAGKKNLGNYSDLPELIQKMNVDELIIAVEKWPFEKLFEVLDFCISLSIPIRITSELFEVINRRLRIEKYIDIPVINISSQFKDKISLGLKRLFDSVSASILLILVSPIFILISLIIKLSSPGPVFFKQTRIGQNAKPFQFYKFRSMKQLEGEDEVRKKMMILFMKNGVSGTNDTKIINESRVTWIGNILRKTSLDELPQLFNVLKGEMSLVGPRPCLPYEFENYDSWQKRRISVIPGCTGVWQVWGRSVVNFQESVVLDIYYINNMSPWLDLQLIFQTLPVMLFSRGAK